MTKYDPDARPNDDARAGIGSNASGEIVPMEAVIAAGDTKKLHRQAELAAEITEERQKRAKEPVHMEGLKPLPPEMRGRVPGRGVIPGGPGALDLAPSMRRTIPPPFERKKITIDHHGKSHAYLRADQVEAGDIVVNFGKVVQVAAVVKHERVAGVMAAVGTEIRLVNIVEDMQAFDPADQLLVFRVHDS